MRSHPSRGTAYGSPVELRVVGHASKGNPSARRIVEVGAVAWDATAAGPGSTGYYFLRARYYDPETGRFIARDRVGFNQRYAYVGNNPVAFRDMNGLCRNPAGGESREWWRRGADALDCALDAYRTADKAASETVELLAYGGYYVDYQLLTGLGHLPDEVEVALIYHEAILTVQQGAFLATAALFDYRASGNVTNVNYFPTGERRKSDIWPDWLVSMVGGDPASCYFPCSYLPGIGRKPGKEGGITVDFQWPLGR